jgi:hypothetical protein
MWLSRNINLWPLQYSISVRHPSPRKKSIAVPGENRDNNIFDFSRRDQPERYKRISTLQMTDRSNTQPPAVE